MARKNAAVVEAAEISITIPIGDGPETGYEAKQAQAGKLTLSQPTLHLQAQLGPAAAEAFLRIRNGLREVNAKLAGGRPVYTNVDALRWLMEQVAAEVA
jgi:hypothetical protein